MDTVPLYYQDAYATEADAIVTHVDNRGGQSVVVVLDRTIFYPEGGGQPADQGEIVSPTGTVKVQTVRYQDGLVRHEGKLVGTIEPGQSVHTSLKWSRRIKYMRLHSAGHLIHDVLMTMAGDLVAIKAQHGDKAFLEYKGTLAPAVSETLAAHVNEVVHEDLPIRTWDSSYDEVLALCGVVPPNLPKNKQLRMLQIGTFSPMPDGGVQVQKTREIGEVVIHHVTVEGDTTTIRYGVGHTLD